jgi:hypothetical protein
MFNNVSTWYERKENLFPTFKPENCCDGVTDLNLQRSTLKVIVHLAQWLGFSPFSFLS